MSAIGKWMTLKEAAEYCSFHPHYFGKILKDYDIPAGGPKRNRYHSADLDEWMKNPDSFLKGNGEDRVKRYRQREPIKVTI